MFEKLSHIARLGRFKRILDRSIRETQAELLDLLREQLSQGKSGSGTLPALNDYYYARRKKAMGGKAPMGIMDLKYSGDFYSSLNLRKRNYILEIFSTDEKAQSLVEIAGDEIYQLNDENFKFYVDEILLPVILKNTKDELFKKK